jgi:allophanate hydrolase
MNLTIDYLRHAYQNQSLTPEDLIAQLLQRCTTFEEHNIWIHLLSREELQPYLDKLSQSSVEDLPLYGVPFAIKDNIDLAGVPTTAACPAFEYIPDESAFVVQQLLNAGAIPIGKTNMDQFATGLVGTRSPEPWGVCKNAFDSNYISGGSSSGSAVSVALGLASFSLGTDTAGSGRVPAAFNNLVGLKPSKGLLSMRGVVPACRSLDCVSIFALTTDDANTVFEQAAVFDAADQYARPNPYDNNHRFYGQHDKPFKFAVPKAEQLEFFGDDSANVLFEKSIQTMVSLGGEKVEIDFAPFMEAAILLYEGPWVAERYAAIEEIMSAKPEELLPVIKTIIGSAEGKTAVDAFKAEYRMQSYRVQAKELLSQFDFLMTPTTGTVFTIDAVNAEPIKLNSQLGYYTNYVNLLDCSCVAVPAGFLDSGLPWGVSLVSLAMKDRDLLSFANRWQQLLKLHPGKLDFELPSSLASGLETTESISLIVCGAHMEGLALNWQLSERGALFQEKNLSASQYRMYLLDGAVSRPGLVRDNENGQALEIEIWQVPKTEFGSFVATIPEPLGIGKVETQDGRWLPGFICETYAIKDAQDITELGGWRAYLNTL